MIEIVNGTLDFGKVRVLDNINLNVQKGEICGIIGRNGSGKTVMFKTICGFYKFTKGDLIINNKIIKSDSDIPRNIGSIIETPGFLGNHTGYMNLKFLADINGIIGKKEIYQAMELVGLDPKSKKSVSKYSLGMRQRLGLAQSFMEGQEILILDEPMNGLDNDGVSDMRKLFLKLKEQGKTILIASHNREDIDILCDRVYRMDKGILSEAIKESRSS